ncbi:MAG: hypothetical protein ABW318_18935 [Vicinamibacterales bacterium]
MAIVIAHGMGQQIPFQTLDDVAEGLRRQDRKRRKGKPPMPVAKTVELGGERLARLELKVLTKDGERDVHLYESYWAPMTEGRVTLRDVMGFLLRAGVGALRLARRPFKRWLFGEYEKYPVPLLTVICLALAIGVVLALTWLSIVIVVVAGAKVPLRDVSPWLTDTIFRDITTIFNVHVALMAPFVLLMIWWGLTSRRLKGWLSLGAFGLAVLSTLGSAFIVALVAYYHTQGGETSFFERADIQWLPGLFPDWFSNVSWVLVVGAMALVRWFLIQYVGDVAAYVQPQVIDRFYELRKEIKKCVWTTANAVYREEEYRDIIMVGHSLGSVVAYDVLNLLLTDHKLKPGTVPEVAGRTRLLLTFGSPLDKTAFIFAAQGTGTEAREAISASFQPLITDEQVRPRWVNIYSRWDIISGSLDYYDRKDRSNRNAVENIRDRKATTLLAAHVEYWRNDKLFETIFDAIETPPATAPR